ncbi:ATP-binding protein, partial [Enterococcus faecalis]|nr:ATP-binding protein [Enterococcus faecalis]
IAEIRNAMEHKSFNILDYYSVESSSGNFNNSEFSYIISYTEFEKITLELFKLTREAIIQLTMIVQMEESKKRQKINKSGGILGELPLFKYKDEWKNIY